MKGQENINDPKRMDFVWLLHDKYLSIALQLNILVKYFFLSKYFFDEILLYYFYDTNNINLEYNMKQ